MYQTDMELGSKAVVVLSFILVFSMVAPPALAQGGATIPNDETFSTNGVEVWQESIFTLRHDFASASSSVKTGQYIARIGDEGEQPLNRNDVGVRAAGESVTLTYDATSRSEASKAVLADTEVQLVAARVTGSGESVTTFSEAIDLISQDNANNNATFEMVNSGKKLNGNKTEFKHAGSEGHYVYFAVATDTGEFAVNDGKISTKNNPTIIGVEQITFERGSPSSVSAPRVAEPGDSLTFNIDTSNQFTQNDVTHAVVVYDQATFSNINDGRFRLIVDNRSDIDSEFNLSEDATLEHEITEVNGVADVDNGISVNGVDISNGRVSRAVNLGTVVDFVAEDINGNPPATSEIGTNTRLDASTTAEAATTPRKSLTVDTFGNWSTGTYQYVYVGSLESNASIITTDTGTVSIQEDIDKKITVNRNEVLEVQSKKASSGKASVKTTQGTVKTADFSGVKDNSDVIVAPLQGRPSKISKNIEPKGVSSYVELNATPAKKGGTATVSITVSQSQFTKPKNAQVYRYNDATGQFEDVNVVDRTLSGSDVTIKFDTQFSTFAIGERSDSNDGTDTTSTGGGGSASPLTRFSVAELTPGNVDITQGESITVTAAISTSSYLTETQDVELRIGGETIATKSVSLQNQESKTVEFSGIDTTELAGEYEYGVFTRDDSATGSVTVNTPDGTEEEETVDEDATQEDETQTEETGAAQESGPADGVTDDGIPGFNPIITFIAIVFAGLFATWRRG